MEKKSPDWERIEGDYRAGVLSLREIAASHGITEGAIRKRAKRDSWSRDLSAKILARADDLVRKKAVRSEVRSASIAAEREVIEANANRIAQVRGEHRSDIARMRKLVLDLLSELEAVTGNIELFEDLQSALASDGESERRIEIYSKAIGMTSRIDSLKKLSEAMKILIGLEREAYGLSVDIGNGNGSTTFERIERVIIRAENSNA